MGLQLGRQAAVKNVTAAAGRRQQGGDGGDGGQRPCFIPLHPHLPPRCVSHHCLEGPERQKGSKTASRNSQFELEGGAGATDAACSLVRRVCGQPAILSAGGKRGPGQPKAAVCSGRQARGSMWNNVRSLDRGIRQHACLMVHHAAAAPSGPHAAACEVPCCTNQHAEPSCPAF